MTRSAVVFTEARKRGLTPVFDPATQSVMIDGQRWDRWYATRDMIAPGALYIHHPHGTQIVLPGQSIRQDDEETPSEHFPAISIRKRPDHARRNRTNPRRHAQGKRRGDGRASCETGSKREYPQHGLVFNQ